MIDLNRQLEFELGSLKQEREESNKLYEVHILKLEKMLEERVMDLDSLSLKYNALVSEKDLSDIRAQ